MHALASCMHACMQAQVREWQPKVVLVQVREQERALAKARCRRYAERLRKQRERLCAELMHRCLTSLMPKNPSLVTPKACHV